MNERFEKLLADAFFDEAADQADTKVYELNDAMMQKFAELIIQECCSIADKWVDDTDNGQNYPSEIIKQHFGVKDE